MQFDCVINSGHVYKKSLNWLGKKRKKISFNSGTWVHDRAESQLCTRFTILERFPSKSIYWFEFVLKGFQFFAVLASHCCTTEMELGTRTLVFLVFVIKEYTSYKLWLFTYYLLCFFFFLNSLKTLNKILNMKNQTMVRQHVFWHSHSKSDRYFYLNDHNFF